MQNIYKETNTLDQRCYKQFHLTEDLLMEHAANGMVNYIQANFPIKSHVVIITGSGNNGADGLALARILHTSYDVEVLEFKPNSSPLGKLQKKRALAVGVHFVDMLSTADVVVDAMFGSGLNRPLDTLSLNCLDRLNKVQGFKIACDIPSGIMNDGACCDVVFSADVTLAMGALKSALFSDAAKEYIGQVEVVNLGVARSVYETASTIFLLDKSDMKLPYRTKVNTHKGTFGHAVSVVGDMSGAAILAATASQTIGAGLCTLLTKETMSIAATLMQTTTRPTNTTALCIGMGLGDSLSVHEIQHLLSTQTNVLDADILCHPSIKLFLEQTQVITPHPKEFCHLLQTLGLAEVSVEELQANRIKFVTLFMENFPNIVVLLKGANVIIGYEKKLYFNTFGTAMLSKGGSGDILTGLITGLLAQGYSPLDATITGSLAHTLALENINKSSFALTPLDLIEGVSRL